MIEKEFHTQQKILLGLKQVGPDKFELETDEKMLPVDVIEEVINQAAHQTAKTVIKMDTDIDKKELYEDFRREHELHKHWRRVALMLSAGYVIGSLISLFV